MATAEPGVAPYQRLLSLIAESLGNAGIPSTTSGASLTTMGVTFHCNRLGLKTKVRFLDRDYTFARYTVEPGVETAVQDVIRELGHRLERRRLTLEREQRLQKQRDAAEAARLAAEELRALKFERRKGRRATLGGYVATELAKRVSDDVFEFGLGTVYVTEDGFRLQYETEDFHRIAMLTDLLLGGD